MSDQLPPSNPTDPASGGAPDPYAPPPTAPAAPPPPAPAAPAAPVGGYAAPPPPPPAVPAQPPPAYGAPAGYAPTAAGPGTGTSGLAIAALVIAILGLLGSWIPFVGLPFPIIGLILGLVALNSDKKAGRAKGVSISAVIVSAISLFIAVAFSVIVGVLIANNTDTIGSAFDCAQQAAENNWTDAQYNDCIANIP